MPKFYKVVNHKREHARPYVLPEAGYKITMGTQSLADNITVLGECDAAGNMLHDIASNNFVSKGAPVKKETSKPVDADPDFDGEPDPMFSTEKAIDPELLSESNGPVLQTFEDKTPTINEQKTTEAGAARTVEPKSGESSADTRKSISKSGRNKSGTGAKK